jgi:hypothetical protein
MAWGEVGLCRIGRADAVRVIGVAGRDGVDGAEESSS